MAQISSRVFGQLGGRDVASTRLSTSSGFEVEVLDYGAIVRRFVVPTRQGSRDIVLGLDDLESYLACGVFMGGIVGRVANRIGEGRFSLGGKPYQLAQNDPPHHLHGGARGFDRVLWKSFASEDSTGAKVVLSYLSFDGEEGYPGNVLAQVEYLLTEQGEFRVTMRATTDEPTLVSLAQHNYWNLGGHDSGTILGHELELAVDEFTPASDRIPLGAIESVRDTALDFRVARPIGEGIRMLKDRHPGSSVGFDHNLILRGQPQALRRVAAVREPESGLSMTLSANQPGMQLYSSQFLDGTYFGKGARYDQYAGLCLETQAFPNAINVPAWADQVVIAPGEPYEHIMVFQVHA
jgi:aldose 1-epimerase